MFRSPPPSLQTRSWTHAAPSDGPACIIKGRAQPWGGTCVTLSLFLSVVGGGGVRSRIDPVLTDISADWRPFTAEPGCCVRHRGRIKVPALEKRESFGRVMMLI